MSFTLHADGGITLTSPRGSLDLSKDQCRILYEVGKYASETKNTQCGIDWAKEAEAVEAEHRKMLEVARVQGYDPMREVMSLKGQLIDLERQKAILMESNGRTQADCRKLMEEVVIIKDERATYKEQLRITNTSLTAAQSDRARLTKELQQEKDAHQALKYQVADLQKISQSFNELKKTITSFWNR